MRVHSKSLNPDGQDALRGVLQLLAPAQRGAISGSIYITFICHGPYGGDEPAQRRAAETRQGSRQTQLTADDSSRVKKAQHTSQEKRGIHSVFPPEKLSKALKWLLTTCQYTPTRPQFCSFRKENSTMVTGLQ